MNYNLSMTISNLTLEEKIKDFILQETFADSKQIQNDTLVFKEGYFDSLGFVRLITYLEEEYGIKISDADLVEDNFESVNAITSFLSRKLQ